MQRSSVERYSWLIITHLSAFFITTLLSLYVTLRYVTGADVGVSSTLDQVHVLLLYFRSTELGRLPRADCILLQRAHTTQV